MIRYDAIGRRSSRTVNDLPEETTAYGYDGANRLTSLTYRGEITRFVYDADGRLTTKVLPNGIRQELTYDDASRLTGIVHRNPDDTIVDSIGYAYDANGRRVGRASTTQTLHDSPFTATYDAADRMTSITLTETGQAFTLTYDDDGNLASKVEDGVPSNVTTYTWDSRSRLIGIAAPGVQGSFSYDASGRRTARTVNGQTIEYVYDGRQAIGEVTNAQATALLTTLGLDEVIARYSAAGARYYLTDALNSVSAQIRPDRSLQNRYAYSAYGETVALGDDEGNSVQYTAREADSSGLLYNRARYYDRKLKRFISDDPIGVRGGLNFHNYVEGNPINFNDPEGLWVNIVGGALIGGLGNLAYQLWDNGGNFECVDWGDVGTWAFSGALTGALVPEGLIARGGMQTVTRWGPSGRWVMTGGNSWRNWVMSGAPELGYPMSTAVTTQVPRSSLAWPSGWEAIKGLIGQRVIVGGAAIVQGGAANASTGGASSCTCKR